MGRRASGWEVVGVVGTLFEAREKPPFDQSPIGSADRRYSLPGRVAIASLSRDQCDGGLDWVAARAAGAGFRNQNQPAGGNDVDPATGTDGGGQDGVFATLQVEHPGIVKAAEGAGGGGG